MKISIVITAYNVGKYIERAVKSVLSQTYRIYSRVTALHARNCVMN